MLEPTARDDSFRTERIALVVESYYSNVDIYKCIIMTQDNDHHIIPLKKKLIEYNHDVCNTLEIRQFATHSKRMLLSTITEFQKEYSTNPGILENVTNIIAINIPEFKNPSGSKAIVFHVIL